MIEPANETRLKTNIVVLSVALNIFLNIIYNIAYFACTALIVIMYRSVLFHFHRILMMMTYVTYVMLDQNL